jgi:CRISPR-associated exonuclease Cas4
MNRKLTPTATHLNYYVICKRKLWLFSNGIQMEHTSDTVTEGKLIGETTYQARNDKYKEIQIGSIKIDFYDPRNKIIHEVKKSDKIEEAHIMQVKYYIYVLEQNEIVGTTGIIEYPKMRQTTEVLLTDADRAYFDKLIPEIQMLIAADLCPPTINKSYCKTCSYYEFCYADETD